MTDAHDDLDGILALLDVQLEDLGALQAEFARRPDVRAAHGYFASWFPSRLDALARQRDVLRRLRGVRARAGEPLAAGPDRAAELVHALGWFRSLGQAFDVDLGWSDRGRPVFVRLGELQRRAAELRARVRRQLAESAQ
jgi:hypothetical protein